MMTYSEMSLRSTFLSRYEYLKLGGQVGVATFGSDRPLNQGFYQSYEWKQIRDEVIVRDEGCDLGIRGMEVHDKLLVHHMNPIQLNQLIHFDEAILNPEYLICVSMRTHNAIHFGDERHLPGLLVERKPGDTDLW